MGEDHSRALQVVDQLHVDVVQRTVHVQAGPLGGSEDLLADALVHVPPVCVFRCPRKHKKSPWSLVFGRWSKPGTRSLVSAGQRPTTNDGLLRSGLAYLLLQTLAGVTHAFVLVRIGRAQAAHFGSHLPDFLAIDSSDTQLSLLGIHRSFNAGRQWILNRMRVTQAEHHRAFAL